MVFSLYAYLSQNSPLCKDSSCIGFRPVLIQVTVIHYHWSLGILRIGMPLWLDSAERLCPHQIAIILLCPYIAQNTYVSSHKGTNTIHEGFTLMTELPARALPPMPLHCGVRISTCGFREDTNIQSITAPNLMTHFNFVKTLSPYKVTLWGTRN